MGYVKRVAFQATPGCTYSVDIPDNCTGIVFKNAGIYQQIKVIQDSYVIIDATPEFLAWLALQEGIEGISDYLPLSLPAIVKKPTQNILKLDFEEDPSIAFLAEVYFMVWGE